MTPRRVLALVLALVLLGGGYLPFLPVVRAASAGPACSGVDRPLIAYASEQITVSNTAIGFTLATHATGNQVPAAALVTVKTAAINVLDDGTNPTSSVGIDWAVGTKFFVCGRSIQTFKAIRSTGSNGTIDVVYYRTQ